MLRVIKLLLYYFAYNLGAHAVVIGIWMAFNGFQFPEEGSKLSIELGIYTTLLASLAYTLHLVFGKYCELNRATLSAVSPSMLAVGIALIVGMGCWNNYLLEAFQVPDFMEAVFQVFLNHPWGIFAVAVVAPLFEEILFRGAIQGYLMRTWRNPWWGIAGSAFIFGVIHGNPVQIPFAFITGLVLGWVYYRTGSLLPGMLMHFVNNASSVALFHLTKTEADTTMAGLLGHGAALALALAGLAVTCVCIFFIAKKIVPHPVVWHTENQI